MQLKAYCISSQIIHRSLPKIFFVDFFPLIGRRRDCFRKSKFPDESGPVVKPSVENLVPQVPLPLRHLPVRAHPSVIHSLLSTHPLAHIQAEHLLSPIHHL